MKRDKVRHLPQAQGTDFGVIEAVELWLVPVPVKSLW
jgi:hypothetical protein